MRSFRGLVGIVFIGCASEVAENLPQVYELAQAHEEPGEVFVDNRQDVTDDASVAPDSPVSPDVSRQDPPRCGVESLSYVGTCQHSMNTVCVENYAGDEAKLAQECVDWPMPGKWSHDPCPQAGTFGACLGCGFTRWRYPLDGERWNGDASTAQGWTRDECEREGMTYLAPGETQ